MTSAIVILGALQNHFFPGAEIHVQFLLFITNHFSVPKSAMYAFVQLDTKLAPTTPPNSIVIVLPASHPILSNSHVTYDIYCPVAVILYPSSVIDPVPPAQIVPPE